MASKQIYLRTEVFRKAVLRKHKRSQGIPRFNCSDYKGRILKTQKHNGEKPVGKLCLKIFFPFQIGLLLGKRGNGKLLQPSATKTR